MNNELKEDLETAYRYGYKAGFLQAIEGIIAELHLSYMDISDIEALRKKVDE